MTAGEGRKWSLQTVKKGGGGSKIHNIECYLMVWTFPKEALVWLINMLHSQITEGSASVI